MDRLVDDDDGGIDEEDLAMLEEEQVKTYAHVSFQPALIGHDLS